MLQSPQSAAPEDENNANALRGSDITPEAFEKRGVFDVVSGPLSFRAKKMNGEKKGTTKTANADTGPASRKFMWVRHEDLIAESNRSNGEDPVAMDELAASIAECGILDPVHVRLDNQLNKYCVIAGRRRVAGFKLANELRIKAGLPALKKVPCILSGPEDKAGEALVDLVTNYAREGLSALDRARLLKKSADERGYTAKELAEKLKLSKGTVSETLSILRLPDEALERIKAGESAKLMCRNWDKLPADYQRRIATGESLKSVLDEWKAAKSIMSHVNGKDVSRHTSHFAEPLHTPENVVVVSGSSTKRENNSAEIRAMPAEQARRPQRKRLKMLPKLLVQFADVVELETDKLKVADWCVAVLRPADGLKQDLDRKAAALAAAKLLSLLQGE